VNGTRVEGQWLVGRRQQSFAVVPNRAGKLSIPETTLTWWNVVENHAETARIPAQTFNVLAAAGAPATPAAPAPQINAAPVDAAPAQASVVVQHAWWRNIALASLGLWVLTVLAWLIWRRRRGRLAPAVSPVETKGTASHLRTAFLAAARGKDAAAQAGALLAWAQAERPTLLNLGEVAHALSAGPQREAIDALQRKRYASADEAGLGERLAAAFKNGFAWQPLAQASNASPLPPLYPFNVRR
jgi:hypothetical protein